ncbi:MAG: imidazoleglycerol-phosphate dehydratase HisB [Clostridiales bacterium]|nr:imidazoleglycerol-phosphate dehydratase HisB [Clostridiales bacterium]
MRKGEVKRKTNETDVHLSLELDGKGASDIDTGCGFLDHMLTLFASHGSFDLKIRCRGDRHVDDHHSVEDIGICLGQAFYKALGDKQGIARYAERILPMDEALILTAVDISGRGYLAYDLQIPTEKIGSFDSQLIEEFWLAFARESGITLHIRRLAGANSHHIAEGAFKSAARSLAMAVDYDEKRKGQIPSTKGVL